MEKVLKMSRVRVGKERGREKLDKNGNSEKRLDLKKGKSYALFLNPSPVSRKCKMLQFD